MDGRPAGAIVGHMRLLGQHLQSNRGCDGLRRCSSNKDAMLMLALVVSHGNYRPLDHVMRMKLV